MKKSLSNRLLILLFFMAAPSLFAQDELIDELEKIYQSLEYNTIAYDDLKNRWLLSDPKLIREVYNRFVVKGALRREGEKVSIDEIKERTQDIYRGEIVIELRKRYYDDEIEYFVFIPENEIEEEEPTPLFDPIDDGFYLKEIVGENVYKKIQREAYFHKDVTKKEHTNKAGYFFDINLNLLDPELMFWNTTSEGNNKYLLSFAGKWGNDYIFQPGWYLGEFAGGIKLTYFKQISVDRKKFDYAVTAGLTFPTGPTQGGDSLSFKRGADALYWRLDTYPIEFFVESEALKNILFTLEGKVGLGERSDYESHPYASEFYANESYIVFNILKRRWFNLADFGLFEFGVGFSNASMTHYNLPAFSGAPTEIEAGAEQYVTTTIGVERTGGLLQHHINGIFGYDISNSNGYLGVKTKFMLSGTFGFEFRIFTALMYDQSATPYKNETFMVFSPIFRVNY
jgi:hypothetical protein